MTGTNPSTHPPTNTNQNLLRGARALRVGPRGRGLLPAGDHALLCARRKAPAGRAGCVRACVKRVTAPLRDGHKKTSGRSSTLHHHRENRATVDVNTCMTGIHHPPTKPPFSRRRLHRAGARRERERLPVPGADGRARRHEGARGGVPPRLLGRQRAGQGGRPRVCRVLPRPGRGLRE